jgi:hypothetical protein
MLFSLKAFLTVYKSKIKRKKTKIPTGQSHGPKEDKSDIGIDN